VSLRRLPNDLPEPNCRTERPSVYIPLGHNKMKQHIKAVFYEHVANFKKSSNKSTKNKNMEWKVRLESKREKEAMKAGFAGRVNDAGQSSKKRRRNGRDTDYPPDLEKKKKMKVQDVQKSRQDAIEAYRRLKAVKQQKQQLVRSQAKKAKGGNKWRS
jgi:hypothetical protein